MERVTLQHHTHILLRQTTGITLIATPIGTSMTMRSLQRRMSRVRRLNRTDLSPLCHTPIYPNTATLTVAMLIMAHTTTQLQRMMLRQRTHTL